MDAMSIWMLAVALVNYMIGYLVGKINYQCRQPHLDFIPGDPFLCEQCSAVNTVGQPLLRCRSCGHEARMS